MSIHRYEPCGLGRGDSVRRCPRHMSSSRSRPSCVGLTLISPPMPARLDAREQLEVVVGDRLGLGDASAMFSPSLVYIVPIPAAWRARPRPARRLDRLAGHEPADRPLHERQPRQALAHPRVAREPQEDPAHHGAPGPCRRRSGTIAPRDVRGGRRQQERRQAPELGRVAVAAQRDAADRRRRDLLDAWRRSAPRRRRRSGRSGPSPADPEPGR